jgi:predicted phosphodiesterase
MTELTIIGDVHGKWSSYLDLLEQQQPERSIQIGDFGRGFPGRETFEGQVDQLIAKLPGDHKYFRGNHDNPAACREHTYCLDDTHWEPDNGLMVVAGAHSIDREWRVEDRDWWADEELSYDQLYQAVDLYEQRKPRIMLTHDGPESVIPYMFSWYRQEYKSRTRQALDSMLAIHEPDLWIFGHWHTNCTFHRGGTTFIRLNELETFKVNL